MDKNEIKELGIVLTSTDLGEADRLVTLLMPSLGKVVCKMRGVKKPKAKLAYASFPFNLGEYLLVKRGKSYIVINCNYVDNFSLLTADLNKYYAASGMLEAAKFLAREGSRADELFLLVVKALKELCYKEEVNILLVLTKFVYELLALSGFKITSEEIRDEKNCYFDFECGRLTTFLPEVGTQLSYSDALALNAIITKPSEELESTELKCSKNVLKLLVLFFEERVDEELKIIKKFL